MTIIFVFVLEVDDEAVRQAVNFVQFISFAWVSTRLAFIRNVGLDQIEIQQVIHIICKRDLLDGVFEHTLSFRSPKKTQ